MITSPVKILTIRAPSDLAERIAKQALAEDRSQNKFMVRALRAAVGDGDKSYSEESER
jgi:hypothetical protein